MSVDKVLLDIMCCPETKVDLKQLEQKRVDLVNAKIKSGNVKYKDGKNVDKPLEEALITVDNKTVYRVDDEIPVMLIEMGISTDQLGEF